MDVSGLGKGGGKNDKKACHTCGKMGHYAKECWWSGKATGKGKGDKGSTGKVGGGKGKDKSGKGIPRVIVACSEGFIALNTLSAQRAVKGIFGKGK